MTDDGLQRAAEIVQVPDGAIPTGGAVVIGYLDSDGNEKYGLALLGDLTYSHVLGLMQMAAHNIMHVNQKRAG